MELTSALVIVNIIVSALSPVLQMIGRIKHSKCAGAEIDVGTPETSPKGGSCSALQEKSLDPLPRTTSEPK
jgi:hypothetical protein